MEKTQATLEHQKQYLRGYSTNAAPQLISGTAWVHHAWNGDVVYTRNQAKNPENFKFETCKEGIPVGSDCMAIPSNAKSPGTALLFIDWMLNGDHAAQNVSYIGYPMPLDGAEDAFAKLVKDDAAIEVTTDDLANGSQFKELTPAGKKEWDRVWTEVKA
jgi:spermidine/putrescine transport system substrate-binding protein